MDLRSKTFKDLQAKWYSKLKNEGFDDLEYRSGKFRLRLKHDTMDNIVQNFNADEINERRTYFSYASTFLYKNKFLNEKERLIWARHCEGSTALETSAFLKSRHYRSYSRALVELVVGRLRIKMLEMVKDELL